MKFRKKSLYGYDQLNIRGGKMINKDITNRVVKGHIHPEKFEFDNEDFVVRPLKKMRLIDSVEGLDDECEMNKNMFNFGDYEDLPESDRSMDRRCKNN